MIKAVEAVHGSDAGWDSEYGDSVAHLPQLVFESSYYQVNGIRGAFEY